MIQYPKQIRYEMYPFNFKDFPKNVIVCVCYEPILVDDMFKSY